MTQRGSNSKVANKLVVASSAAVIAVYAAGYSRTQAAAEKLEHQTSERMPARPVSLRPVAVPAAVPVPVVAAHDEQSAAKVPAATLVAKAIAPTLPESGKAPVPASPLPAPAVAPVPEAAPQPAPVAAAPPIVSTGAPVVWKDGKYSGWGTCRHGDIQATVTIEAGKIASAVISDCQTRYSCDVIDKLPPEVVQRQSADVDHVSGATQSADAFYWAVVTALKSAQQ